VVRQACFVSLPFPEPTTVVPSRAGVFLGYLDYFRSRLVSKLEALPDGELRVSRLPSSWTRLLEGRLLWSHERAAAVESGGVRAAADSPVTGGRIEPAVASTRGCHGSRRLHTAQQ
jgi:hypothetical protein